MTGQDILQAEFEKAGMRGGYKADQVDEFLKSVAGFVDAQENDKNDLEYKIKILAEKIEQYKKEEDKMKEAYIGAQAFGKHVVEEAKTKAEEMLKQTEQACDKSLNEAKKKADLLTESTLNKAKTELAELQRECLRERELLEKLKSETSKFRKSLLDQYKSHIAAVQNLPALVEQSFGMKAGNPPAQPAQPTQTENKAKQILREEETKIAKERVQEPIPKQERTNSEQKPKSKHVQVPKNKLLEDEESKLEKSKTLDFDSENINLSSVQQSHDLVQQPQLPVQKQIKLNKSNKSNKSKQENEPNKGNKSNRHAQTERPDYVKKWGDLEFGKNQGN